MLKLKLTKDGMVCLNKQTALAIQNILHIIPQKVGRSGQQIIKCDRKNYQKLVLTLYKAGFAISLVPPAMSRQHHQATPAI